MDWKEIPLAIAINLDVFSQMTSQGARLSELKAWQLFLAAGVISLWQVIVVYLSQRAVSYIFIESIGLRVDTRELFKRLASLFLIILGIFILARSGDRKKVSEVARADLSLEASLSIAALTSIDALFVGLALAFQGVESSTLLLYVFIFGLFAVIGGVLYGRHYGHDYFNKGQTISGSLFLFLGIGSCLLKRF